jgi:hypothetical protein
MRKVMISSRLEQTSGIDRVALLTPTYGRDLTLCGLLCESVDRHVSSFSKHYLLVPDSDLSLFSKFESPRRAILPASQFLPEWLRPLPAVVRRKRRQFWWSLRAKPVSGWHIQQILKIAAVATLPHTRYCILDSDVVFFRDADLSRFEGSNSLPLLSIAGGVKADQIRHARWVETTHRILGLPIPPLPASDFIGHIIFWDQSTIRAMIRKIEVEAGRDWIETLCRVREFSEYMLYGYFVQSAAAFSQMHIPTDRTGCVSYWDPMELNKTGIVRYLSTAKSDDVAFSAASFSETPVEMIRDAIEAQRSLIRTAAEAKELARLDS